jgi:GNAT superfamily N-acetyltransferase
MDVRAVLFRFLNRFDLAALRNLAALARVEGFDFLDRLIVQIENDLVRLDDPHEFFLCASNGENLVGVGGITPDPYLSDAKVGRVRHVYVHPQARRSGIGRRLIYEIECRAAATYSSLRLRTDTSTGARFYEALGYRSVSDPNATHVKI